MHSEVAPVRTGHLNKKIQLFAEDISTSQHEEQQLDSQMGFGAGRVGMNGSASFEGLCHAR